MGVKEKDSKQRRAADNLRKDEMKETKAASQEQATKAMVIHAQQANQMSLQQAQGDLGEAEIAQQARLGTIKQSEHTAKMEAKVRQASLRENKNQASQATLKEIKAKATKQAID